MIAIVGHNGSGKSTLAKHFNGLLLPTSGRVLIDGMDTKDESLAAQNPPACRHGIPESG